MTHPRVWKQLHMVCLLGACLIGTGIAVAQDKDEIPVTRLVPGASVLTGDNDVASDMIDGIDRFLLRKIAESEPARHGRWTRAFESDEAYSRSIAPNRISLARMLGAADSRVANVVISKALIAESQGDATNPGYRAFAIHWPVLEDPDPGRSLVSVYGEGILLEPNDPTAVIANVIAIPDCDQTPTAICGLSETTDPDIAFAKTLAELRCRVFVPMLVSREINVRGGRAKLTNREYVYRSAFELGRHVIGYEVQMARAVIDSLHDDLPIGVIGVGEGGRIALATAALDERVDGLGVAGSFGASESIWHEPIDRNVFGLLNEFGNAEMLTMVAPRPVLINHCKIKSKTFESNGSGAPAEVSPISPEEGRREVQRAKELVAPLVESSRWPVEETIYGEIPCDHAACGRFVAGLTNMALRYDRAPAVLSTSEVDEAAMQRRLVEQFDRHNQLLLRESPFVRRDFMSDLKTDSLESFTNTSERYRTIFRNQVIGNFDDVVLPANARIRKTWDHPKWIGYEVVMDVYPDVIAAGVLIVPRDMKPDEKRPVVVCQHGLEGRPTDTFLGDHRAYHDFAGKLAERGFITFAPQNPYIFKDRFRTLQRKANLVGKTLFSVIVPQHQQIVDWLKTLPNVDGDRIAFYGLSYGGKSAMRIPALVTDYCLSICSADFNEWVGKNASTREPFSYVWTGEYEIFEWNLGSTFNYSEMASLICPRPFMVERGHFDGVGTDEWVAYEYAKVRNLYAARLKIGDRTEIEWFDGPHTINGKGTFDFLHRHLNWPKP
ncbi:MAG: hypothetical protein KDB00_20595 [Planctomycetales bacterium]|nr:hypothetical protein [Planctomycetales bacterium]